MRKRASVAAVVAWFTAPGKELFVFAQESWREAGKVSWPTRKETLQTTLVVFAFAVIMALFVFAAVFAPVIAGYDPLTTDAAVSLARPGAAQIN